MGRVPVLILHPLRRSPSQGCAGPQSWPPRTSGKKVKDHVTGKLDFVSDDVDRELHAEATTELKYCQHESAHGDHPVGSVRFLLHGAQTTHLLGLQ